MDCQTCHTPISSNFCPDCGRALIIKKINLSYFIHEFEHIIHFEKGVFFTFREMLLRPGKSVNEYLTYHREKYMKPMFFLIITSLVYSVTSHYFELDESSSSPIQTKSHLVKIFDWVSNHYGYANLIMSIFIAIWIKLLFRKREFNYFEILVLLCYIMGVSMVFSSFLLMLEAIFNLEIDGIIASISLGYFSWSIGQFYSHKMLDYFKGVVSCILGLCSFLAGCYLLAFFLD